MLKKPTLLALKAGVNEPGFVTLQANGYRLIAKGVSRTIPSSPADARIVPSGEKATARTVEACPVSVPRSIASPTLQIRTVLSYPHDAMVWPSGEIATALIRPECPVKHHHRTVEQRGKYVLTLLRDGNAQHLRRTM